jgi:hypothetical protein
MDINMLQKYWNVTVTVDGEKILSISTDELAGIDDIDKYKEVIEICANNLLCFVGKSAADFMENSEPKNNKQSTPCCGNIHCDEYSICKCNNPYYLCHKK